MAREPEDISPSAGSGYGAPGRERPTYDLRRNPDKFLSAMRAGARARLENRSWRDAARESGIPYATLKAWQKKPDGKSARVWRAILEEEAIKARMTPEGQPIEETRVTTEGFETPEQLAEAWALHATKVQIEAMLDPKAARKERIDAAKRIQDLSGHSPVSKSVVITAPLDDPRVAKSIMSILEEVKLLQASGPAQPLAIEGEVLGD